MVYTRNLCANPLGSIKDRIAKYIIEKRENPGLLKPGMTIIEGTSGNTGIAFSYFAREKGYPVVIVMAENVTTERKTILRNLGGRIDPLLRRRLC